MVELSTKQKGNITEMQCAIALMQKGYKISFPYGEDCKYDMIVDTGSKLYRVQCKTASPLANKEDGFKFKTRSTIITTHGAKASSYSEDDIELFATMYEGKCYIVPVQDCGNNEKTLRFHYPSNGQRKGISLAENYELELSKAFE